MKSKDWVLRNLPVVLEVLVIVVLTMVILSFRLPETARKVQVGCILIGAKDDRGWNESHYNGLLNACRVHGCAFAVRESVPENEATVAAAVKRLVDEGTNVIFMTSFGYGAHMDRIAREYPRVAFFGISGEGAAKNSTTYFGRLYQARYLTGIIAGTESKTGVLGYVAAMPIPETHRDINAYALGMRVANPQARLIVRFTGSWDDEAAERESVARLQQKGADVITYHEDKPYAIDEAEKRGLMSIGYDTVYEEYSDRFLTAAINDWKAIYKKVLGDYLSGRGNFSDNYWLGLEEGGVALHPLSPRVSAETEFLVSMERQWIVSNRSVFSGIIYDNRGTLRCGEEERISDHELFTGMNWFAEGVEIDE